MKSKRLDRSIYFQKNAGNIICCICGLPILDPRDMNIEHEPPRSRQKECGCSHMGWAHIPCNQCKANLTMDEYILVQQKRIEYALDNWNLKARHRRILLKVLQHIK